MREELVSCKAEAAEAARELEWARARLMSMSAAEGERHEAQLPVDTVPRDLYKQLEADVQALQNKMLGMHTASREGAARARSGHCRFVLSPIHVLPYSLTYSVPLFLNR